MSRRRVVTMRLLAAALSLILGLAAVLAYDAGLTRTRLLYKPVILAVSAIAWLILSPLGIWLLRRCGTDTTGTLRASLAGSLLGLVALQLMVLPFTGVPIMPPEKVMEPGGLYFVLQSVVPGAAFPWLLRLFDVPFHRTATETETHASVEDFPRR
jgi:hypothetical protein